MVWISSILQDQTITAVTHQNLSLKWKLRSGPVTSLKLGQNHESPQILNDSNRLRFSTIPKFFWGNLIIVTLPYFGWSTYYGLKVIWVIFSLGLMIGFERFTHLVEEIILDFLFHNMTERQLRNCVRWISLNLLIAKKSTQQTMSPVIMWMRKWV